MSASLSRELVLPATRLSVPDRPRERTLSAIAKQTSHLWTQTPRELATQQVVRLALAAIIQARLTSTELPTSPDELTLGQAAHLFSPHVQPDRQAFQFAVIEAVNSGVPAAVDPLREALRQVGVTGREPIRMFALGLDRLPPRAAQQFWASAKASPTVTAIVGALAADATDVSGFDRRDLARADAVVLAGGKVTPITLGRPADAPKDAGKSWLDVPLSITRRHPGHTEDAFRGRRSTVDLGLRAEGWSEVFETTLAALGVAMQQLDLGARPAGRLSPLAQTLASRLVAAKDRPAVEVVSSLRAVEPVVLDLFDGDISVSDVRIAIPVPEDEMFAQLLISRTALNGPLLVGSTDVFLGGGVDLQVPGKRPGAGEPRRGGGNPGGRGGEPRRGGEARRVAPDGAAGQPGGSRRRRPKGRRGGAATEQATAPAATPDHGPASTPENVAKPSSESSGLQESPQGS